MLRTIVLISFAIIATGVLASFKSNISPNDKLGI